MQQSSKQVEEHDVSINQSALTFRLVYKQSHLVQVHAYGVGVHIHAAECTADPLFPQRGLLVSDTLVGFYFDIFGNSKA